jgi:hypothetical protein
VLSNKGDASKHNQFTIEMEENNPLPFLDVVLRKKGDGKLGYQVYIKKTHTDRDLHEEPHHHPTQKGGCIHRFVVRATRISNKTHLNKEFDHLLNVS